MMSFDHRDQPKESQQLHLWRSQSNLRVKYRAKVKTKGTPF